MIRKNIYLLLISLFIILLLFIYKMEVVKKLSFSSAEIEDQQKENNKIYTINSNLNVVKQPSQSSALEISNVSGDLKKQISLSELIKQNKESFKKGNFIILDDLIQAVSELAREEQLLIWEDLMIHLLDEVKEIDFGPSPITNEVRQKRNELGYLSFSQPSYEQARSKMASLIVGIDDFTPDEDIKNFIDKLIIKDDICYVNAVQSLFFEMGISFKSKANYIEFVSSYLESDKIEVVYTAISSLICYYHTTEEDSYKNIDVKILKVLDKIKNQEVSNMTDTNIIQKEWYSKENVYYLEKLLRQIKGELPRYDPSNDKYIEILN